MLYHIRFKYAEATIMFSSFLNLIKPTLYTAEPRAKALEVHMQLSTHFMLLQQTCQLLFEVSEHFGLILCNDVLLNITL